MAKTSSTRNGVASRVEVASTTSPSRPVSVAATGSSSPTNAVAGRTPTGEHSAAKAPIRPTPEQVGRRAYEIYLDRCQGGKPGTAQSDWAQAEAELGRA